MVTLPSWLVSIDFGTWSYRCLLSNFHNNKNLLLLIIIYLLTAIGLSPGGSKIIIIIIIILGISFMQGIYTYIPETTHVPREHRVATILM
jgi:hypothetical protein